MPDNLPIVITGASSGIGKAAALALARQGKPLVLICREGPKARAAQAEIIRLSGNRAVELEPADLSVQADVRAAAQSIRERHPRLGGLVNNAGASFGTRRLSADGIEMTWAVNHLAPFLLTNLLLKPLKAGAPARIVTVASDLQRPLHLDDLARAKAYAAREVYGETKLANILFTFELARRLAGSRVTANALAPGFIRTNLMHNARPPIRALFAVLGPFLAERAEKGGDRVARLMLAEEVAGLTGEYVVKTQPAKASAPAYDKALAAQLWAISERMTGLAVPAAAMATPADSA
jgi:NAD(P)-dependent dehydrogenase (short-subunit alcohol dehydrogenase family)